MSSAAGTTRAPGWRSSPRRATTSSSPSSPAGTPERSPCRSTRNTPMPSCSTRWRTAGRRPSSPRRRTARSRRGSPARPAWTSSTSTSARTAHRAAQPPEQPALMIYTSGTTGRPKGVVHTQGSLAAQIDGMVATWGWSPDDRIVLVLPLNHVHGIANVTLTPLAVGACCEAPGGFDADRRVGAHGVRRGHPVHGRADGVRPPRRGVGRRRRRRPAGAGRAAPLDSA